MGKMEGQAPGAMERASSSEGRVPNFKEQETSGKVPMKIAFTRLVSVA
jgi:hypothetical protein